MLDQTSDLLQPPSEVTVAVGAATNGWRPRAALAGRREHPRLLSGIAGAALIALAALSALLVVVTAAHPSFMTPTANPRYFPGWMAGPLGGAWPGGTLSEGTMHWLVTAILAGMYLAYLTTVALSARVRARWVIAAILAAHLAFLLAAPLQYTDVFNYINYGRMGVLHHLNPYETVPMLEPHGDPAFAISNWHWLISPYGPLFTLFTYALVPLGIAGAFWGLKLILCVASLAVLGLVWRCAQLLGRDPVRSIALVGLNPILLVWGLGADHNDILMVLPLTLGVYLLVRARAGAGSLRLPGTHRHITYEHLAAAAFVAAAGIKVSAAVVIPIAFAAAPRRRAFAVGLLLAAVALAAVSALAFGLRLPGLGSQTKLVTDVGPPNLLGWALGQGGETDTLRSILSLLAAAVVVGLAVRARRPASDWIALAGWGLLAVWLTTSWFAPWYVVWLLPFAALAARRRLSVCVLALGVYLLVAFGPKITPLLQTLHFSPYGSTLGEQHYRVIAHLVQ